MGLIVVALLQKTDTSQQLSVFNFKVGLFHTNWYISFTIPRLHLYISRKYPYCGTTQMKRVKVNESKHEF